MKAIDIVNAKIKYLQGFKDAGDDNEMQGCFPFSEIKVIKQELAAKDKRIEIYKTALENVVNPGVDIYMADCINIARQALTKGEGGQNGCKKDSD